MSKRFSIIFSVAIFLIVASYFVFINTRTDASQKQENLTSTIPKLIPKDNSLAVVQNVEVKPEIALTTTTLLFVGDIMLDRNVNKKMQTVGAGDYNFPFAKLKLPEADFRIANLEGPVTDNKSVVNPANLQFTFSPKFLVPIKNNFDVVSLANNHTDNFGRKGLETTKKYLEEEGIKYFGNAYNDQPLAVIIEKNNLKIGLVGYNQLASLGFNEVIKEIKTLRTKVDILIVMPHWGVEYQPEKPSSLQKSQGRQFIDAGADLVMGGHPHVIQPIEEYKGKYIFYSLGNFIFDQYFSKETMQGLTVLLEIGADKTLSFVLNPIQLNLDYQPSVAEDRKQAILDFISKYSIVSNEEQLKISSGVL